MGISASSSGTYVFCLETELTVAEELFTVLSELVLVAVDLFYYIPKKVTSNAIGLDMFRLLDSLRGRNAYSPIGKSPGNKIS